MAPIIVNVISETDENSRLPAGRDWVVSAHQESRTVFYNYCSIEKQTTMSFHPENMIYYDPLGFYILESSHHLVLVNFFTKQNNSDYRLSDVFGSDGIITIYERNTIYYYFDQKLIRWVYRKRDIFEHSRLWNFSREDLRMVENNASVYYENLNDFILYKKFNPSNVLIYSSFCSSS